MKRKSRRYLQWKSTLGPTTCLVCRKLHGKLYVIGWPIDPKPPKHPRCACRITLIDAIVAGQATKKGEDGADWWLKYKGMLPDYYITPGEAEKLGWIPEEGNLDMVAPGKMIFRGRYYNKNEHLPEAPGRIWGEVDIDYKEGYRGKRRLLFSNDGLMFVTYDHYLTFKEII